MQVYRNTNSVSSRPHQRHAYKSISQSRIQVHHLNLYGTAQQVDPLVRQSLLLTEANPASVNWGHLPISPGTQVRDLCPPGLLLARMQPNCSPAHKVPIRATAVEGVSAAQATRVHHLTPARVHNGRSQPRGYVPSRI